MARALCYIAQPEDEGIRLDTLLAQRGFYGSRSAAARACDEGRVLVAGQPAVKKCLVASGNAIVYEPDEVNEIGPCQPEPIDLDIRYEDEDLIVLSKQVGLVCHPSPDHANGTLVNALLYHCGADHLCNVQGEDDRLGIVHRLDQDTSGLMLAAKTDEAGQGLMDAISVRAVDRHYLALVHGIIAVDSGMIDAPIARSLNERTQMAVRDVPSARDALTTFRVLERFEPGPGDDGYTLVECKLFTGRTHQIRVHMQYIRHPLVGDCVYTAHSPKNPRANLGLERQFLHSYALGFEHPITEEALYFRENPALDLARVLEDLAPRSRGKTQAGLEIAELLEQVPWPRIEGQANPREF